MCKIIVNSLFFTILITALSFSNVDSIFNISQYSRAIQVDALLMEWNSESCKKIDKITVDAALTPDYLTGYIHFPLLDENQNLKVKLSSPNSDFKRELIIDTSFQLIDIALEIIKRSDSSKTAVLEWQLPIRDLSPDTLENISLTLLILNSEGNKYSEIMLKGKRSLEDNDRNNIPLQIILISVLLIAFILMKKKARKKYSN